MVNNLNISLTTSLRLQHKLTPKLQQALKLLALPLLQLEERVEEELIANPVLEAVQSESATQTDSDLLSKDRQDEAWEAARDYLPEDPNRPDPSPRNDDGRWEDYVRFQPAYQTASFRETSERANYLDYYVAGTDTLNGHLEWQLSLVCEDERELAIAKQLAGNLSEDGYLRDFSPQELIENLALTPPITVEEVERVLVERVHGLDPLGVGARNLSECLLIQLRGSESGGDVEGDDKDEDKDDARQLADLAERIIVHYLPEVGKREYKRIARTLGGTVEQVREAVHLISALDPKPARNYDLRRAVYVSPDVFVDKTADGYRIHLNEWGVPRLKVGSYYRELINREGTDQETRDFIRDKVNSAIWFIRSIDERRRTILRVTEAIMEVQHGFLEHGIKQLKPLTLQDIADKVDLNASTISRATSRKYVQTPRGLFELRFFFPSGASKTEVGDNLSSTYVKERIRQLIAEETGKPLSDQKITDILSAEEGLSLSRRTVAKYRTQLKIPAASKRKPL